MAYIYLITCTVNGKKYVGKTNHTVEKRWNEHCGDYLKERCKNRPLYRSMKKYGVENFKVETLEKCSSDISAEREIYWINKLDTYKHGYNATIGGDGSRYIDYDKIVELYKEHEQVNKVAKIMKCSTDTVTVALREAEIEPRKGWEITNEKNKKPVKAYDKITGAYIKSFETLMDASKWIVSLGCTADKSLSSIRSKITGVASGKRKSAYGYTFEFVNPMAVN